LGRLVWDILDDCGREGAELDPEGAKGLEFRPLLIRCIGATTSCHKESNRNQECERDCVVNEGQHGCSVLFISRGRKIQLSVWNKLYSTVEELGQGI